MIQGIRIGQAFALWLLLAGMMAIQPTLTAAQAVTDGSTGGNSHFYFEPPLVPEPVPNGDFDATLLEHLRVDVLALMADGSAELLETFTAAGRGSSAIRMDERDEHYLVNWHTRRTGVVSGALYRLRVRVVDAVLGHADVAVVDPPRGRRPPPGGLTVVNGQSLPVKFRVEENAVFVIGPEGGTALSTDGRVALELQPGDVDGPVGISILPQPDFPATAGLVPGAVYEFLPDGLAFNNPVLLTMPYDPDNVTIPENRLTLLDEEHDIWTENLTSLVDTANDLVAGFVTHFSGKAVGQQADDVVIAVDTALLDVGESAQLTLTILNPAGQPITHRADSIAADPTGVLEIDNAANTVTAIAPGPPGNGEVTLTVTSGTASSTFVLVVEHLVALEVFAPTAVDEETAFGLLVVARDNKARVFRFGDGDAAVALARYNAHNAAHFPVSLGAATVPLSAGIGLVETEISNPATNLVISAELQGIVGESGPVEVRDITAPQILRFTLDHGASRTLDGIVSLQIVVRDATPTVRHCSRTSPNGGFFTCPGSLDLRSSTDRFRTVWLRVTDQYGNRSTAADSIFVDTHVTVSVRFHRIVVVNDGDPFDAGELEWHLRGSPMGTISRGSGSRNSGDSIHINRTYNFTRLRNSGAWSLTLSSVDRDGFFESDERAFGSATYRAPGYGRGVTHMNAPPSGGGDHYMRVFFDVSVFD